MHIVLIKEKVKGTREIFFPFPSNTGIIRIPMKLDFHIKLEINHSFSDKTPYRVSLTLFS